MLKIIPLKEEHLEDAALLVSQRYAKLREQEPHLPGRYTEVENLLPLLRNILNASGRGVAALHGNRLVGFLTGWLLPSFRGKRSIYSPEWANATDMDDSQHICKEMYSHLAGIWVADQYLAHYISLFPNDTYALNAWNWMGFGLIAIDGLRVLDPLQGGGGNVDIRQAELQDIELVIELHEALRQFMRESPIFLPTEKQDQSYYEEWLQNPNKVVWLAYMDEEPVAFMRLGPADDDVCTIIVDEKTTSIYSAFTKEKSRRGGIATALLDHALKSSKASGYVRCAVSFEPMNLLGSRFWLQHFKPVCLSVVRHIDKRLKHD